MDTYKTTSTLEGLCDIKKGDSIQITSFNHASTYKEGNEEYLLSILVIRSTEKIENKPTEKPAEKRPAGIIIP